VKFFMCLSIFRGECRSADRRVALFQVDIFRDSRKTPHNDRRPVRETAWSRMTHDPMPQPESYGTPPSWDKRSSDKKSSGPVGEAFSAREVTDVFKTLAAHGGGTGSFDLALDLVLNEVVEQARLATGATGAAIALARAGEMVCRATTGGDAPELGVRFEMTSGLSGACLQTGTIQQCGDTETDPRVNAEAYRRLGVRSIMVLPLSDGKDSFGILEVFSSRPNAFSDQDIDSLQLLAHRVVENKRGAERELAASPRVDESHAPMNPEKTSLDISPDYEQLWRTDESNPVEEGSARRTEVWTSILVVLVIVAAVLLGLALGWRGGVGLGLGAGSQKRAGVSSAAKVKRETNSAGEARAGDTRNDPGLRTRTSSSATSVDPSSGGLMVTQNGKVIYRLPPEEKRAATDKASQGSEDVSASRLIHRVEPQYPPDARERHIQGLVTLDVQIGDEGVVRTVAVVEGDPVLAEAAIEAVRQWRYRPYLVDGRPVEMQTRITIKFTLPPS